MKESANAESKSQIKAILFFAATLVATLLFYLLHTSPLGRLAEIGFILAASAAIAVVIWQACDPFAEAAQWTGQRLRIPSSVRGATLDAVASSMPELFTGLFFVTLALTSDASAVERLQASAEGYGSTIATCAGSSIYNMILIPAICAIAIARARKSRPDIEITPSLLKRDGNWVLLTQAGLLIFLFQPTLSWWMGVAAIGTYVAYVGHLAWDTWRFRKLGTEQNPEEQVKSVEFFFGMGKAPLNGMTAALVIGLSTLVAAAACYLLVKLTQDAAEHLGVPEFFVAVILTAAVSSIPDTFVSLGSARRGDDSGAMANVFGSNIFDICIGMSIPLLVSCYLNDWEPITLVDENDQTLKGVVGLRVFLFILTVIAMAIMWKNKRITEKTGWLFVLLYASFVGYAILGALEIFPS